MNSLIWWELGNTLLHKGLQSIKWKSATYWHCMIRAFHPFCAAYPFWSSYSLYIIMKQWFSWVKAFMLSPSINVQSLLPSGVQRKCYLKLMTAPTFCLRIINQNQSQAELSVMCMLHSIKVERLTLSCLRWDCRAGYAEWSHPAACLSWCRNLQTCRSALETSKKSTAVSAPHTA